MKILTKTLTLSLIFSAVMLLSNVQPVQAGSFAENRNDTSTVDHKNGGHEPDAIGEFDFDFDDPFFFSDRIVVNIYDQHDELIYTKSFTKEESRQDAELKAILKKSEYLLNIGNQYYYAAKK